MARRKRLYDAPGVFETEAEQRSYSPPAMRRLDQFLEDAQDEGHRRRMPRRYAADQKSP